MNKPTNIVITPSSLNSGQLPITSNQSNGKIVAMSKAIKNPSKVSANLNLQHSAKSIKK